VENVSFVVPTLNSERTLSHCLQSVANQDYTGDIEIIVADGGSSDETLNIAKKYKAKIVSNRLKTGEAGKAVGLKKAGNHLICFLDSDNVLPNRKWLNKMVEPFSDDEIIGSEPWKFSYFAKDGIIDRYCALMGMNDPLCYFIGNYDHWNYIDQKWTRMKIVEKDNGGWLKLKLNKTNLPTMGANGPIFRKNFLEEYFEGDYFFDIDFLPHVISQGEVINYAKVKIGIQHLYCGSNFKRFYRKQHRRIRDMLARRNTAQIFISPNYQKRQYRWGGNSTINFGLTIFEFILNCLLIFPLFIQALRGYLNKRSNAWLIHPLMCWLTLIAYGQGTIESFFFRSEINRDNWKQ
jgi:glycosyltransferase involved in cell wall biosynthesis